METLFKNLDLNIFSDGFFITVKFKKTCFTLQMEKKTQRFFFVVQMTYL